MGDVTWIARDEFGPTGRYVGIYSSEPRFCEVGRVYAIADSAALPVEDFERITGFKLKPGECKRVRIKIEEV